MRKEDCWGRATVQIRLCIQNGETPNGSDPSFFSFIIPGLVRAVMAPSCFAFSAATLYWRFHMCWILLHTAPGSAPLPRWHSHTDHQTTIVLCVYCSRSSRFVLCLYHQGSSYCLRLLLSWALAKNYRTTPPGNSESCLHLPCVVLAINVFAVVNGGVKPNKVHQYLIHCRIKRKRNISFEFSWF